MIRRHLADAAWLAGILAAFVLLAPVYLAVALLALAEKLREARP